MRKAATVKAFVAMSLLAACTESIGPPPVDRPLRSSADLHFLRHAGGTPRLASDFSGSSVRGDRLLSIAPTLESYEFSFWAVRGEGRSARIDYTDAAAFLRLDVPGEALSRRPDGTEFAPGDSVLITVSVDQSLLVVQLAPSGLVFSTRSPAALTIWYANADPDLDEDGDVDETDEAIEVEALGVWYQAEPGRLWQGEGGRRSDSDKSFRVDLFHFSNYAVSW